LRVTAQPAFVLHRRAYRETSLLLEVLTRAHGRLGLIAKGARRPRNPLASELKPFQPLLIGWSGRGELPVLTGAEPDGEPLDLVGEALYCGFYLNELLVRLLHRHDPHEQLFDDYRHTLVRLAAVGAALWQLPAEQNSAYEQALRIFEKRLLAAIGYGLVLDRDVASGSPIEPESVYDYYPERGPILAAAAAADLAGSTPGVRVRGATLIALAREALDREALAEAKRLLRAVLARHLGPRPLRSRELYGQWLAARLRRADAPLRKN
jgi:DNA repair protein RecO (recombination protein O)